MRIFTFTVFVIAALSGPASSQQTASPEMICKSVMAPLLAFTSQVVETMETFEDMLANTLESKSAETFAKVAENGRAMSAIAEQYRKSFILACYGQ